ncbi:hypothetical protein [Pseudoxanthomonas daejeonensis]|nr:hypothetical protein [Pseudoxanthomonas daejeonensis]
MATDFFLLLLTLAGLFAGVGFLFLLLTRHVNARAAGRKRGGSHG